MMSEAEVIQTAVGPARLRRSTRRTLAISVHPDGSVEMTAPNTARIEDILSKVVKRAAWIRRQQRAFAAMNARRAPRRFSSGATHRYLGRQYRLKIRGGALPGVKLSGGYFHITTGQGSEAEAEQLLSDWMRGRAKEHFFRRMEDWLPWCQRHRLPAPQIVLRLMPKRWGSAQRNGRIALNPELVRAPSACIDYVIAHEVCHLKHPDHGPEFYRQLDKLLPEWREMKRRLEQAEL